MTSFPFDDRITIRARSVCVFHYHPYHVHQTSRVYGIVEQLAKRGALETFDTIEVRISWLAKIINIRLPIDFIGTRLGKFHPCSLTQVIGTVTRESFGVSDSYWREFGGCMF